MKECSLRLRADFRELHVTYSRLPCTFQSAQDVAQKTTYSTEEICLRGWRTTSRSSWDFLLHRARELYMYNVSILGTSIWPFRLFFDIQTRNRRTDVACIEILVEVNVTGGSCVFWCLFPPTEPRTMLLFNPKRESSSYFLLIAFYKSVVQYFLSKGSPLELPRRSGRCT